MLYLLLFSFLLTGIITFLYNKYFVKKSVKINNEAYKNIGVSGITLTAISDTFGVVSFKDDLNDDKTAVCFSYREKIDKGKRILITDYDVEKEMYVIDEYPNV